MQQIAPQCANCGAFTRRSLHHEEEYQTSMLLKRLRTTNFPATDEEISHVQHTILPTVSDDISSIDYKVASLREVITAMEEERERLQTIQKKYHSLVSLHRALPSELWSEIFLSTLSTPSDSNAFDASGSIWRLSHVCQKWRTIALSLHSFWSTLRICFPKAAQQEADVQRLETIIQRSRQGPIKLSLSDDISDTHNPSSNPSIQKHFLDVLLAESYRWRELHLADRRGGLNMLYAPLHNRLPRLELVGLHYPYLDRKEHSVASVFKDCPRLKKLVLGGASTLDVDFPWAQITELDLSCMDFDGDEKESRACMLLIRRCPSLETLCMPYWDLENDGDKSLYTAITCSNMRKLDATSVPVIDALTLPRLQEASFHPDPVKAHYDSLYAFKQLLIRSNCLSMLTNLSLASVPLATSPDCTLHSILSQTHSLAFLNLAVTFDENDDERNASDQDQIVMMVTSLEVVPTKPVTFLPLLSSLNIRIFNHHDIWNLEYFGPVGVFASMASMAKVRWLGDDTAGLARLTTCHVAVHAQNLKVSIYRGAGSFVRHIFDEAERVIFDALIDDGMDLAIRVTSLLTENVGGNNVVFAVSR